VRCRDKPYKVRRPQPGDGYACQQTGIHQHAEGRCTRTGCAEATSQWPNAAVYPWQSDQSSLSLAMGLTTIPSSAGADEAGAHWFARLALRLPADINPAYGDAIFMGLGDAHPMLIRLWSLMRFGTLPRPAVTRTVSEVRRRVAPMDPGPMFNGLAHMKRPTRPGRQPGPVIEPYRPKRVPRTSRP
jgi:hypothetical protein